MLKNSLRLNMNKEGLAGSYIWANWFSQSLGYTLINILLNALERHYYSAVMLV